MKNNKQYSDEFKELIIKECQETGNVALVACIFRHIRTANPEASGQVYRNYPDSISGSIRTPCRICILI